MWNFSDLAKKAQEATQDFSLPASTPTSLFSLDAMQDMTDGLGGLSAATTTKDSAETSKADNDAKAAVETTPVNNTTTAATVAAALVGAVPSVETPTKAPITIGTNLGGIFDTPEIAKRPMTEATPVIPKVEKTEDSGGDGEDNSNWDFDEHDWQETAKEPEQPSPLSAAPPPQSNLSSMLQEQQEQPKFTQQEEEEGEVSQKEALVLEEPPLIRELENKSEPVVQDSTEEGEGAPPETDVGDQWNDDLEDMYDDDDDDEDDEEEVEKEENVNSSAHEVPMDQPVEEAPVMVSEPEAPVEISSSTIEPEPESTATKRTVAEESTVDDEDPAIVKEEQATAAVVTESSKDEDEDKPATEVVAAPKSEPPVQKEVNEAGEEAITMDEPATEESQPAVEIQESTSTPTVTGKAVVEKEESAPIGKESVPPLDPSVVERALADTPAPAVEPQISKPEKVTPAAAPVTQSRTLESDLFAFMGFGATPQEQATEPTAEVEKEEIKPRVGPPSAAAATAPIEVPKPSEPAPQPEPVVVERSAETQPDEKLVPASVLDQVALQMQRLEEHHADELKDAERRHQLELEQIKASFSQDISKQEQEREALEKDFVSRLREKDVQIQEMMQSREGTKLKMDLLQRELDGTTKLLQERDSAMGNASQAHSSRVLELESKLAQVKEEAGVAKADVHNLKSQVKNAKDELEKSGEAYAQLKERVKVVATELKERRMECRTLAQQVGELTEEREQLQTQIVNLQSQLSDRDRSEVEKGEKMDQLKQRLRELEEEVQATERKVQEQVKIGDKALAAYKKKAQNSLAVANARTAAAQQAKEEAELEASAARTTADQALERARVAEAGGKNAMAEAKEYVKDLEGKTQQLEKKLQQSDNSIKRLEDSLKLANDDVKSSQSIRDKLNAELSEKSKELQKERNLTSGLQQEVSDLQSRCNQLYDEVETLRDELRKTATAAIMATNSQPANGTSGSKENSTDTTSSTMESLRKSVMAGEKSESEATIVMLQGELRDANQAIRELKETLRSTIEHQQEQERYHQQQQQQQQQNDGLVANGDSSAPHPNETDGYASTPGVIPSVGGGSGTNDSTPLFFAIEKHNELKTARQEINRLANLLGDAQSEKMEAYDVAEEMRRQKEHAEARLARYEKLGPANRKAPKPNSKATSTRYGGYGSRPRTDDDTRSIDSMDLTDDEMPTGGGTGSGNSAQVNLEYLKNVMLSYLNAKTVTERKALVPVVAAVLCLTPEEQQKALKSVDESGSVENVGLSLFETIGSQVKGLKL